ncbi:MAG: MoaD/ThiS family protein [Acidimicrobiales bacterium]
MAQLLLLGPARDAAGRRHDSIDAPTLADLVAIAVARYGPSFEEVLRVSQIWVNGVSADPFVTLEPYDEVAVLPPVSGG